MREPPTSGLAVFLAIAEHGSLRAAAAALGVQPPAVSYRLKALEDQIGVAVFTRTNRSVRLTDAGRAVLSRVRPGVFALGRRPAGARGLGKARTSTRPPAPPHLPHPP